MRRERPIRDADGHQGTEAHHDFSRTDQHPGRERGADCCTRQEARRAGEHVGIRDPGDMAAICGGVVAVDAARGHGTGPAGTFAFVAGQIARLKGAIFEITETTMANRANPFSTEVGQD